MSPVDLRQAIRALRTSPAFTVASLLVLALGIGATTAIFSVVDAVVLRGLPFDESDRLVAVGERPVAASRGGSAPAGFFARAPGFNANDPEALSPVRPPNWVDWVAQQGVFESMTATVPSEPTLFVPGAEPEGLMALRVTASFFTVFRVRPVLGRPFTADEEVDGRHRVAVLSHALWQRVFNGAPDIIGRTLMLDDGAYDVIGVMGPGVTYRSGGARPTDLWIPYVLPPAQRTRVRMAEMQLQVVARLKEDATLEEAQAQMAHVGRAVEQANPEWNRGSTVGVRPLADHLVGASMRTWMLMLLSAVGLVLLIACANVANLLLARSATREREVAVRAALGASRPRLVGQLLVESVLLSVAGAVLGVLLAWWAVEILRVAMPDEVPRADTIALNWRVLAAASALMLGTGVCFGLLPALQVSRPNLTGALSQGSRSGGGNRGRQRLRRLLVVVEVALALVLVVGSTLFIGSFVRVMRIDPGFASSGLLTMHVFQRGVPGRPPVNFSTAFVTLIDELRSSPGVISAAVASPSIPLRGNMFMDRIQVRGDTQGTLHPIGRRVVTPDYHKTLGVTLLKGRFFDASDREDGALVVIINAAAERQYFGGADAIGRTLVVAGADRAIVGVVSDARQGNLEAAPAPELHLPLAQSSALSGYVIVRTQGDPYAVVPGVRAALARVLPTIPLRYVASMDELIAQQMAPRRITMLMFSLFGVLGLVIAAVGVYGVMAYLVSQRTREFGVRMALGATRGSVIEMVLGQAVWLAGAGVAVGAAAAWYLTSTVQSFLFELEAGDLRAFAAAAAALLIAALVASAIPARRAASVDPTEALRSD